MEINIDEEIKKLESERKMILDQANVNIHRINGAISLLTSLDKKNKDEIKKADLEKIEKDIKEVNK